MVSSVAHGRALAGANEYTRIGLLSLGDAVYVYKGKERGRLNAVARVFCFPKVCWLNLEQFGIGIGIGIRIGRGSSILDPGKQKRRGRGLQCLAWYGKLIALPTATEFGQMQG